MGLDSYIFKTTKQQAMTKRKKFFPCIKGSFMGSASYDELFIKDIKDAMDDIDRLLLSSKNPNIRFILLLDY